MLGKLLKSLFGHAAPADPSPAAPVVLSRAARAAALRAAAQRACDDRHLADLQRTMDAADAAGLTREEFPAYEWAPTLENLKARLRWETRTPLRREDDTDIYAEGAASLLPETEDFGDVLVTDRGITFVDGTGGRSESRWHEVSAVDWDIDEHDDALLYISLAGTRGVAVLRFMFRVQAAGVVEAATLLHAHAIAGLADAGSMLAAGVTAPEPSPADDEDLDFETDIVGESFDGRQGSLQTIVARASRADAREGVRFMATLAPEPTNRYDRQAVAVHDRDTGARLGYLARHLAAQYQVAVATAAASGPVDVPAIVRGGEYLGVWIDLTQFNAAAGLPSPERLIAHASTYFERREAAGLVDGVPWATHLAQAVEAGRLGQHEVAAGAFEQALTGWMGALAFDGRLPAAATLFEDYARWCRKAKREDLELSVLSRYVADVAPHEPDSTRCARVTARLSALRAAAADDAPF